MPPENTGASDEKVRAKINYLAVADPDAAQRLQRHLEATDPSVYRHLLDRTVEEIITALTVEVGFGRHLADGLGRILKEGARSRLDRYRRMVMEAAENGPARGALFAKHLAPVLACNDARLADRFEAATRVMVRKGTYTLKAPLETLSGLVETRQIDCAHAFLDLLHTTYCLDASYNRTVYLTHTLPKAVDGFAPARRLWQIRGLERVIRFDEHLADHYLKGMASGLNLLSPPALNDFLDQAFERHHQGFEKGARFLSLESRLAVETCRNLTVTVPLTAVRNGLERYLQARIGRPVAVRPLSSLSPTLFNDHADMPLVHCDSQAVYLPEEMDLMGRKKDNAALYKLLAKQEAGLIEFGTFDLDAHKALDSRGSRPQQAVVEARKDTSDLELFIGTFESPSLALDLFILFEHGRLARLTARRYPGLFRRLNAALTASGSLGNGGAKTAGTLWPLYRHLVLGVPMDADPALQSIDQTILERWRQATPADMEKAETSACLTMEFYPTLSEYAGGNAPRAFAPLCLPYGRRLIPAAFTPLDSAYRRLAVDIQQQLAKQDIRVYRSDVQDLLENQHGLISRQDIRALVVSPSSANTSGGLTGLDLESMICSHGLGSPADPEESAAAFRYREWDWCLGDYLPDRTRVREHRIETPDTGFYRQTLTEFNGLVKRIRYAFELMRPEEMTILRQWRDGDAFDYRALLDYALDRKAGLMPSDRLFIKRMKRMRDVAALLLVDLSRSTANTVNNRGMRVIDVEKQAIVLLCEALAVIGDRFAIAGFSGTGPLGVDYYGIKNLKEPFDEQVKGRIGAMAPQRSTRMGAAIRHAMAQLSPVQARVRLIIILGDGFPNDLEYKGAYAVEDTRRAVMEARAEAIHVKAITVNVADNKQLDRLYGATHHTLIGNIQDLPDRLVRVYSALTKH